uniref:Uncharacterized protein n=1 Tax=Rhizophora mucronata TaxID=61149 RepID=A0A2P2QN03_RHIMU
MREKQVVKGQTKSRLLDFPLLSFLLQRKTILQLSHSTLIFIVMSMFLEVYHMLKN